MTSSDEAAVLRSLSAQCARGVPAAPLLRALVRAYVVTHRLPIDVDALVLFADAGDAAGHETDALPSELVERLPGLGPDILGHAHEVLLEQGLRHRRGAFYTPPAVADALVALVLPDHDRRDPDPHDPDPGDPDPRDPDPRDPYRRPDGHAGGHPVARARRPAAPARVPRVLDPAVGGGAFLLAAARRLEAQGWSRREIVDEALWGVDIDPLAVAVTDATLQCWAAASPETVPATSAGSDAHRGRKPVRLVVADTLRGGPTIFPSVTGALPRDGSAGAAPDAVAPDAVTADGFDVVVGNPPFQNQLGATTARGPGVAVGLGPWLATAAYRYADTATVFLAAACRLVRPGGRVGLILPQSFLVADDAAAVRDDTLARAQLEHLWVALEPVFRAGVRVCAPVVRRRADGGKADGAAAPLTPITVQRWRGSVFTPAGPAPAAVGSPRAGSTWAPLVADLHGLPEVAALAASSTATRGATLGDLCEATAGFRDQYYGIVPATRDATAAERDAIAAADEETLGRLMPLVTCGLIDPVWGHWAQQPTKFAKRTWQCPVVDLGLLRDDPALEAWARARQVPKIVVATQTRVIEGVVDVAGSSYPSVPAIALRAAPARLWDVAAVVLAPAVTVWAFHRHAGAALSSDALKVSARQILAAPLPGDERAWAASAAHLRDAHAAGLVGDVPTWREALERFAVASADAYGLDRDEAAPLTSWWLARLPHPDRPRAARTSRTRTSVGAGTDGAAGGARGAGTRRKRATTPVAASTVTSR